MSTSVVNTANKFITIQSRPNPNFTSVLNNRLTHYKDLSRDVFHVCDSNKSYYIQYYITLANGKFVTRTAEPFILYPRIAIKRLDFRLVYLNIVQSGMSHNAMKLVFDNLKFNNWVYNNSPLTCVLTIRFFENNDIYNRVEFIPRRTYTIQNRDLQTHNYIGWLSFDARVLGKYMEYDLTLSHSGTVFQTYDGRSARYQIPATFLTIEKQFFPQLTYNLFINKDNYKLMFRCDASEPACYVKNGSNEIDYLYDVSKHLRTINHPATTVGREPLDASKLPTRKMKYENLTNSSKKAFRGIAWWGNKSPSNTGVLANGDILKYDYTSSPAELSKNHFTIVFVFELPTNTGFGSWSPLFSFFKSNGITGMFAGNANGYLKAGGNGILPNGIGWWSADNYNKPFILVTRTRCIQPPSGSPISAMYTTKTDIIEVSTGTVLVSDTVTTTNNKQELYNAAGGFLAVGHDEITPYSPDIRWGELLLYNQWIDDGYIQDLVAILRDKWKD